MATAITMPQLGESVTEGTVGSWLKKVGDRVEKYEPLLEVISDKVDTEITATESGTLLSIDVPEGETVPVGTVLCYIGAAGEQVSTGAVSPATGVIPTPAPAPEPEPEPEPEPVYETPVPTPAPQPVVEQPRVTPTPAISYTPPPVVAAPARDDEDEVGGGAGSFMTPVVARMIAEHGIDISKVTGTGRDGRVTKRDIEVYLESRKAPATPVATPPPASAPRPAAEPLRPVAPPPVVEQRPVAPAPAPAPIPAPAPTPVQRVEPVAAPAPRPAAPPAQVTPVRPEPRPAAQGELVPLTNMRRRIAEHMVASKRISPHVTTVFEVDLSAITAHRDRFKGEFDQRGVRLTFMAYFVEAVARTLQKHRMVNATFTDEGILLYNDVNIGMAAAVQGGAGLIVPVIKHSDEKNLMGIAREVQDLTNRARAAQLTPNDVSGGTFTITNHGVGGSLWGTPIINQPQSAILGIGKFQKRVVVLDNDAIAVRPMAYVSLTFDHRVLDGASGDAFMSDLLAYLENYK